ncbi:N-acetyltransferase [Duganella sp. BJB488]|uniref:GNAT family N-acetyltransferase n=1 Tax=unclassified Duganella TaxID=2636909 RepID=UPI000E356E35|nr:MULTISPECIES: GNAT family N-acetyltransferase [unclassified Duganella]NVD74614.1 GNAT family N-acetyltransferase [Duganella sp. BJB1802]RFP15370.1 N-acetyltransferase [Duganella sp. BJB489]RFP19927.1 N-acetyltransferase [Duganella sp. BJB488]RFP38315.1 N-acetyltransferase [Duganella sp. BJB480]
MPLVLQFVPLKTALPLKALRAYRQDANWPTDTKLPSNPIGKIVWVSVETNRKQIAIARLELAPPEFCMVSELIVNSKYRSQGVGRWFVQRIEQYCHSLGIRRLVLRPTNGSEKFYASLSFQKDPFVPEMLKKEINPMLPKMFMPIGNT